MVCSDITTHNSEISGFSTAHVYKYKTKQQAKSEDRKKLHFCWLVTSVPEKHSILKKSERDHISFEIHKNILPWLESTGEFGVSRLATTYSERIT